MFGIKENWASHVLMSKNKTQYTFTEHASDSWIYNYSICTIFFVPYFKPMSAPYWYYKKSYNVT